MKKTLLLFCFCVTMLASTKALAQFPYELNVFDQAVYYGMYEGTVSEPVPQGAIRLKNWSYAKMLTAEQLASFGNTLTMTVTLNPLCDNYDRIGNVNLTLVPVGQATYEYNDANIKRIEIGRFITPFMNKNVNNPNAVPYVYDVDYLTDIFHDANITAEYNIWIELEVYGYQGGPGQGGAAEEIPGCAGRNDVYMGSLSFSSGYDSSIINGSHYMLPLSYKYELKNYTLDGTDVLGETVKTINFDLPTAMPNVKLHLITSNHGSNTNGEEYVRRDHFVYFDDQEVLQYKPGGLSCVPYRIYNTQFNCIYAICYSNGTWAWRPNTNAAWSWNNWCPGDKVPIRTIELGDLAAGSHSFKIEVPDAQFADGQGYFPMSVFLQSVSQTLNAEDFNEKSFSVHPNPVNDIAVIETQGREIQKVTVTNTLGQSVLEATSDRIDLSGLQSGIYVVKVLFGNSLTATKKIVKK
ncbi:peptide-N-glycosidase F-related protein [Flavobacterium sp. MFBS3-15]|uniref:peptide-N-glycosidase F-related protein n=1 Tax=Flavobacterium sp. MFBS3-15 TaxID=2989816 RepID=UPI002235C236|nr:peptide-N-glycosidase F-related protein [Flavobacterium sp. MFBS3-15]MCW4470559.1 peptide-N-glycosidase F-related protein [Flavobacterium sp. MFBS3-15]